MPEKSQPSLTLTTRPEHILGLTTLLQRGFFVPCRGTISLMELLLDLLEFDPQYIAERIETIFINGFACDSLEQSVGPGTSVALSAAMPGLAGAIFRKGGAHASLRSQPAQVPGPEEGTAGFITVKLFNLVAADKGKELLTKGIIVKGSTLNRFFSNQQQRLRSREVLIQHDAATLSMADASQLAAEADHLRILLRVDTGDNTPLNNEK